MSGLKTVGDYITAAFKLGRTERLAKSAYRSAQSHEVRLEKAERRLDSLLDALDATNDANRRLRDGVKQMVQSETHALMARNAELARNYMDLSRRLDQVLLAVQGGTFNPTNPDQLPKDADGFGAVMDSFYHKLENKYRGTTADIRSRLRVYLPDVESAVMRTGGKPVMDIGCGRGEWLGLLNDSDITAIGIDTNSVQIADVQDMGLDARKGDARTALSEAEDDSLACITAHHLIEHLPFEDVLWIVRESMRVLAPGGLLLFETPNVRNVLVGASSFHNDPTHLHPMTDPVMSVMFETVGFFPIETRHLHPHEKLAEFMSKPGFDPELANLLFGAQDLAILGQKPLQET
ncbi:class I SAM-dependent methyltransferase [Pseudosulfitobacter pseudonitzschiae]|uniref:class I SAM-dependent methyltransferase n=1 Tax=Pseudosulfitobacter pseudonitzschiae TaxID=1402135 RepID=UPI001AF24700|nr:methyltransferase domain-containing protein [Pseudosulfitobacter pseudonitzschiae]MBM1817396.1 methyltransferase domain-containing protein [Pseudosulfitobacter pseudonitzschiae]MBM1834594.1 methyltransferase domain-containing protein [Pseudosulfitobacter pseudonitzschiae]MBM1839458.1 methyltransferase domain-containing protein [Pseudosulfitobacter pseudonitzschiae]MBM1844309.1 methyltransferase domain-containing protein [Pseudosulfitobacter pseudonitzschiae]MBM1849143.1 methyltransferase do